MPEIVALLVQALISLKDQNMVLEANNIVHGAKTREEWDAIHSESLKNFLWSEGSDKIHEKAEETFKGLQNIIQYLQDDYADVIKEVFEEKEKRIKDKT